MKTWMLFMMLAAVVLGGCRTGPADDGAGEATPVSPSILGPGSINTSAVEHDGAIRRWPA
jgi:hypothetical protein